MINFEVFHRNTYLRYVRYEESVFLGQDKHDNHKNIAFEHGLGGEIEKKRNSFDRTSVDCGFVEMRKRGGGIVDVIIYGKSEHYQVPMKEGATEAKRITAGIIASQSPMYRVYACNEMITPGTKVREIKFPITRADFSFAKAWPEIKVIRRVK